MKVFLVLTLVFLVAPPKSQAYLDPGTGSFIVQVLIGGVVGGLYVVKLYSKKVSAFFQRILKKNPSSEKQKN